MIILLTVLAIWFYVVIGFCALALAVGDVPPLDGRGEFGALTGIVILFFWPIVSARMLARRWRLDRVKRSLETITEDSHRAARAYELLGRQDGDRVLEELAIERSLVEEEHCQ